MLVMVETRACVPDRRGNRSLRQSQRIQPFHDSQALHWATDKGEQKIDVNVMGRSSGLSGDRSLALQGTRIGGMIIQGTSGPYFQPRKQSCR